MSKALNQANNNVTTAAKHLYTPKKARLQLMPQAHQGG